MPTKLVPKHLTKREFGNRLYALILEKGWSQSELARQSGLSRDKISTYATGRSLPTPQSLSKLATALGVEPDALLPNQLESQMDRDPSLEMLDAGDGDIWLRINRLVSMTTAIEIATLLEKDRATRGEPVDIFS